MLIGIDVFHFSAVAVAAGDCSILVNLYRQMAFPAEGQPARRVSPKGFSHFFHGISSIVKASE
jgi:hypothetical protein